MVSEADERSADLAELLRREIGADGPLAFSTWVERSLYTSGLGFYEGVGEAGGRRGDFVTSVETGPLFAALVGEWLDRVWQRLGRPDPFSVVEAAAGVGTLWRGIRRAAPACLDALDLILVERSDALRSTHGDLPEGPHRSASDLPGEPVHVVFANELLDNLVFDIAERIDGDWFERRVDHDGDRFVFAVGPALDAAEPLRALHGLPDGSIVPVPTGARAWLERARANAEVVVMVDYGASTAELAERGAAGWLRTYAQHTRGADALDAPGRVDITHDVPFDQLPTPKRICTQADWLRELGLDERLETARRRWQERAGIGDLEAMFARSAITESAALTDPTGLGAFSVLEW